MLLEDFERLARSRRSIRNFRPDAVPVELLERLLDIARWAPSGYNLQPTHMITVTDPELKSALQQACLNQKQILTAPAVVVFTGDRRVLENNAERSLDCDLQAGTITPQYADFMRKNIALGFKQGPLGINWLWKALLAPIARLFRPVPSIPAVEKQYWVAKQVMLVAMNFMLAASAAGLATVPMEGFDESRIKRLLKIPSHQIVVLVIPIGYAVDANLQKTRLPIEGFIHRNSW